jgi:hypothetical protein
MERACNRYDSFTRPPRLPVQSNIKGSYNNEIVVGGQYQYWRDLVVGASFIRRWLGRVIEDGGASYADPKHGIFELANPTDPKPERTYTALQLTATKRLAKNWFFAGAYTYSRTMGNYTGLYDSGHARAAQSEQFHAIRCQRIDEEHDTVLCRTIGRISSTWMDTIASSGASILSRLG